MNLKKSDLLAQTPKFHYLLNNIINQEDDINNLIRDNNFKGIIDSVIFYTNVEFNSLIHLIENVIESNTTDENIISNIYDRILSLVFIEEDEIKQVFYKLYTYTITFNKELSNDYKMVFLEYLKEDNKGNDDVLYKKLKKL